MPRRESPSALFAVAAFLATAALAGCRDQSFPTRPLAPGAPRQNEVMSAPVVNSLADDGDGTCTDTKCTLRDAIAFASAGATITFSVTGTITLAHGQLDISKNLTISGPGADQLAVDGNKNGREFRVFEVTANMSGLTIENGHVCCDEAVFDGGGIFNLGTLTLTNVTISGNETEVEVGGGIFNAGVLTIFGSTISGNAAGAGGGIANDEIGTATIINSTISGDSASEAGGIENTGSLTLINSTVAGNIAMPGRTGGISTTVLSSGRTTTTLFNTIVANNPKGGNCAGPMTDGGYNIEDGTSCGFTAGTSHSNTDPQLDPAGLVSNGGPTRTIALSSTSPAIDAIPPGMNGCGNPVATDQRGVARPFGPGCDIGAYEANPNGFLPPINNVRTNPIHPGKGVPVQFSLGGFRGLDIFALGSPSSVGIRCPLSAGAGDVVLTDTPGNSGLSYDPSTDTYTYVWKTDKAWDGTCRRLIVALGDGSVRTADFAFVR